jgi:plasmid stabilization system protein ParE
MKVRILPDAESDLSRAAEFYDAQRDGTGEYFIACLAADIEALKVHAGVHERQHGLHRAFSKRFPFAIFYEVTGTTIEIFAVLDCRQDPESIESRLRGYE